MLSKIHRRSQRRFIGQHRRALLAGAVILDSVVLPVVGSDLAGAAPTLTSITSLKFHPTFGGTSVHSVVLPNGSIVVDNSRDGSVIQMNADGTNQRVWATGLLGLGGMATYTVQASPLQEFIYIAHAGNGNTQLGGVYRFNADGTGQINLSDAAIINPQDVATDATGNVYVADTGSQTAHSQLFQLTFSNSWGLSSVSSLASQQFPSSASLNSVTVDPASGDIFVSDQWNSWIDRVTLPGPNNQPPVTMSNWARTYLPDALTISGSNLLIGDAFNQIHNPQIRSLALTNAAATTLTDMAQGSYTDLDVVPTGTTGVAAGTLFIGEQLVVSDPYNLGQSTGEGVLLHADAAASNQIKIAIGSTPNTARFSALAYDELTGKLLVADEWLGTVYAENPDGSSPVALITGWSNDGLDYITDLAVDNSSGTIFVGSLDGTVRSFSASGGTETQGTLLTGGQVPSGVTSIAVVGTKLLLGSSSGIVAATVGSTDFTTWAAPGAISALTLATDGRVYATTYDSTMWSYAADGTDAKLFSLLNNSTPVAISSDALGRIFITDASKGLVEASATGIVPFVLDNTQNYLGTANDAAGHVFIADSLDVNTLTVDAPPTVGSLVSATGTSGVNSTITITGSGFSHALVVDWMQNGAVVSWNPPTIVSSTSITVSVPTYLAPGVYNVVVVTPGGPSATSNSSVFTELSGPPIVNSAYPNSGSINGGTAVTVYGQYFSGVTAVSFGGRPAAAFTVNSGNSITAVAPASTTGGTVDIRVTSARGTSSIAAFDRFTYTGPLITAVSPSFGRTVGGDLVTITGVGLSTVNQIKFGTIATGAATFTAHTATKIVVKSPAHGAGFVQLVAAGTQGSSALSIVPTPPNGFTFQGVPTVTKLLPKSIPHGLAKTVVITGTGFLGASKVIVGTTTATIKPGGTSTSMTILTKALPKGTYGVLVTTASGTSVKTVASTLTVS